MSIPFDLDKGKVHRHCKGYMPHIAQNLTDELSSGCKDSEGLRHVPRVMQINAPKIGAQLGGFMASASTVAAAPAQVAPELLTITRRPAPYRIDDKAKRGYTGEGSFVTRGTHVKTSAPALVHVDGSTQTALPLGVVGAAILHGVITDAEIASLQAARDSK